MRRLALGFSLLENVFAAMMIAVVILGLSSVITTYTVNQAKTSERPFAVNLAQQMIDEVLVNLVTHNAMNFDTAIEDCPTSDKRKGRGRAFYMMTENINVSQYYFNNFPIDARVDPCVSCDTCKVKNNHEMAPIPWATADPNDDPNAYAALMSDQPVPDDVKARVYDGDGAYIRRTLFYRNRFYRSGGQLVAADGEDAASYPTWDDLWDKDKKQAKGAIETYPRYAVRFQLFGIPAGGANLEDEIRGALKLKPTEYKDDPRDPPASASHLIGDSCISASTASPPVGPALLGGATGRIYINERKIGETPSPDFYPHMTSKVLIARVYRIKDYTDDGTFYTDDGTDQVKVDREIASASHVFAGRIVRK